MRIVRDDQGQAQLNTTESLISITYKTMKREFGSYVPLRYRPGRPRVWVKNHDVSVASISSLMQL